MIILNIITTVIAGLGFILAGTSLGWQIWTRHQSRKEDVRGRLSIGGKVLGPGITAFGLFLDIWNNGNVRVYIKSVSLNWGDEGQKLGNTLSSLLFNAYPPLKGPLEPGEPRSFVLPAWAPHILKAASEQSENKIWVSANSSKGEVLRIAGHEVKPILKELIKPGAEGPDSQ